MKNIAKYNIVISYTKRPFCIILGCLCLLLLCSFKYRSPSTDELIQQSDVVAVAEVQDIISFKGKDIAEVAFLQILKGPARQYAYVTVYYQPVLNHTINRSIHVLDEKSKKSKYILFLKKLDDDMYKFIDPMIAILIERPKERDKPSHPSDEWSDYYRMRKYFPSLILPQEIVVNIKTNTKEYKKDEEISLILEVFNKGKEGIRLNDEERYLSHLLKYLRSMDSSLNRFTYLNFELVGPLILGPDESTKILITGRINTEGLREGDQIQITCEKDDTNSGIQLDPYYIYWGIISSNKIIIFVK